METIIFLFCLIGCGIHCWVLGTKQGIVGCIDSLIAQGYLEVDEDDTEENS